MHRSTSEKDSSRGIGVLDRTKALFGPRTRAYGETNYLQEFWTEPRHCMVLGLGPMGKPTALESFGQNQGTVWSSDSSLWGNQLLKRVLDRTKALYGPRTRAYGETNYLREFWTEQRNCMVLGLGPMGKTTTYKKNYKFWTELRHCMVLGLEPMGKPTT